MQGWVCGIYGLLENFEMQIQDNSLSEERKNQLYRSIIDCIVWTLDDNNISIKVRFKTYDGS